MEKKIKDKIKECKHPYEYQESAFGGGVLCAKCKKLINLENN